MKDRALLAEIRKRLALLERQQENLNRDVEAVKGVLAMLEWNIANEMNGPGYRTHAELVGDFVVELLSVHGRLHRKELFEKAKEGELYFGDEKVDERRLASFSAILSKDTRLVPSGKNDGIWESASSSCDDLYCPSHDDSDFGWAAGTVVVGSLSEPNGESDGGSGVDSGSHGNGKVSSEEGVLWS